MDQARSVYAFVYNHKSHITILKGGLFIAKENKIGTNENRLSFYQPKYSTRAGW